MGIQHPACTFINTVVEMLISVFFIGHLTDSHPSNPSWHSLDKHSLYANVFEMYLHVISHAAAYGGIAE